MHPKHAFTLVGVIENQHQSYLVTWFSFVKGPQVQQMELIPVEDFVMEVRGWKKHAFSTA